MKVRSVALVVVTLALLALACAGSEDIERRNQEVMASLPVFEKATLVRTYATDPPGGPFLWYEFASTVTPSAAASFYRRALPDTGWQLVEGQQTQGMAFRKDGAEVNVYVWGHEPPAFQTGYSEVAPPPPGTLHSFVVRAGASGNAR